MAYAFTSSRIVVPASWCSPGFRGGRRNVRIAEPTDDSVLARDRALRVGTCPRGLLAQLQILGSSYSCWSTSLASHSAGLSLAGVESQRKAAYFSHRSMPPNYFGATWTASMKHGCSQLPSIHRPRISPDGQQIRFSAMNNFTGLHDIWQIGIDGSNPHLLFPEFRGQTSFGEWTPNGKLYFFYRGSGLLSTLWAVRKREPACFPRGTSPFCSTPDRCNWNRLSPARMGTEPMPWGSIVAESPDLRSALGHICSIPEWPASFRCGVFL